MVEFWTICGTSLPKGDLTVKAGRLFTSHDYTCPSCGKLANPAKAQADKAYDIQSNVMQQQVIAEQVRALLKGRVIKSATRGNVPSKFTFYTGPPEHIPAGFLPWFRIEHRQHRDATIVCGHWASLGLHCEDNLLAIDSGCVWGRELTAIRLEDRRIFQVPCNGFGANGE